MASEIFVAFPVRIVHGMVATCSKNEHVRQMIEQVLFTMPGERVMYPEFGSGLERLIFEEASLEIAAATQTLVAAQLHRWLGDVISIHDVNIRIEDSRLSVDVVFELLETREILQEHFER